MSYEEEIDLLRNEVFELRKGEDTRIVISELMARIDVQTDRIAELEAQVAALKEIAVEGWAVAEFGGEQEGQDYHLYFREWNIDRESYRKEALELLQAEHPEAFK